MAGLTSAALSHVSLVCGFGSSCSQPLLAKRPSNTVGSARNTISRPLLPPGFDDGSTGRPVTVFTAAPVSGTSPSCSALRQNVSNPAPCSVVRSCQQARTASWLDWLASDESIAPMTSWGVRPP